MRAKFGWSLWLWLFSSALWAAPSPQLWPLWDQSNPHNEHTISHDRWQQFLNRYIILPAGSESYFVDYANVTAADAELLALYLDDQSRINPCLYSRDEQLAFWLNLHNALVVDLLLKHRDAANVQKIETGWFEQSPWQRVLITVDNEPLSLDDIKHRILRPIWRNPHVHYALVNGAVGSPDLLPVAFDGQRIYQQLKQAAHHFINQQKAVAMVGDDLLLSSIFEEYQADFGGEDGVLLELKIFAEPKLRQFLIGFDGTIDYQMDWTVNALP